MYFHTIIRRLGGLGLLALLAACSPLGIVNGLVPRDDFQRQVDLAYGEGPRQKLDIYVPTAGAPGPRPVVVFFYGGNWQNGKKADYLFVGQALASKGFVVVIPDYRLYPEISYPTFLEDGARAVAWVMDHAAELGGDPARIHLMGHSAGAYNAAMLALDDRWLGARQRHIRSFVGLAGPYDFLPLTDPDLQRMFSTEPDLRRTQPVTYADAKDPPVFLASGLEDTTVLPRNAQRLAARLGDVGGQAEEKYYEGIAHIRIVGALAAPFRSFAPVLDDVTEFLNRH